MSIAISIYNAVKNNNVGLIKSVSNDKDFTRFMDGAMVESAKSGSLDVIKYLTASEDLTTHANIYAQNAQAFISACDNKNWDIVEYFLEKGIDPKLNKNYLYRKMIHSTASALPLFTRLLESLKQEILDVADLPLKLGQYEVQAIEINDTDIQEFIDNIILDKIESTNDDNIFKEILRVAIENKNTKIIKAALDKTNLDDSHMKGILKLRDKDLIDLLLLQLDITNPHEDFLLAVKSNSYIAFKLLQKYEKEFLNTKQYLVFDNMLKIIKLQTDYDFFTQDSCLPRHYSPITSNNDLESFSAMLLDRCLDSSYKDENSLEILTILLDNKIKYNIKDKHIVQLLVEGNYNLAGWYENDSKSQQFFIQTINLLIEKKISFKSDDNGYLFQLIVRNNLGKNRKLTTALINNGSNVQKFISRLNDNSNWLTEDQEEELMDHDCNNDRDYDLYKKFDTLDFYRDKNKEVIEDYKNNSIEYLIDK